MHWLWRGDTYRTRANVATHEYTTAMNGHIHSNSSRLTEHARGVMQRPTQLPDSWVSLPFAKLCVWIAAR